MSFADSKGASVVRGLVVRAQGKRVLGASAAVLAAAVLMAGCGGSGTNDGGMPTPVEGDDSSSSTSTPTVTASTPTAAPTKTAAPPRKAQVVVVPGNYADNPAVQGLVKTYPVYFNALVARDSSIIKSSFPAFFYADVSQGIDEAKAHGWVMRPPGSVVVVGTEKQAKFGVVRVKTCRSQTTQFWDPKAKQWTLVTPRGLPQAIDMIQTGLGWMPYRLAPSQGINCAKVRYPA